MRALLSVPVDGFMDLSGRVECGTWFRRVGGMRGPGSCCGLETSKKRVVRSRLHLVAKKAFVLRERLVFVRRQFVVALRGWR